VGRKTLRIFHTNSMEVRKKRPRGVKKEAQGVQASPLNPRSVSPCEERDDRNAVWTADHQRVVRVPNNCAVRTTRQSSPAYEHMLCTL
jgi:hypothetical protein